MSFATLRRISIHYEQAAVENMITMLEHAFLPQQAPVDPKSPWNLGIDYDYLRSLKLKFETEWNWNRLQAEINSFDHFLADYENGPDKLQLHFVHKKSDRVDAIPLLMLHGWPGRQKQTTRVLSHFD
jgi:hypothetical protein